MGYGSPDILPIINSTIVKKGITVFDFDTEVAILRANRNLVTALDGVIPIEFYSNHQTGRRRLIKGAAKDVSSKLPGELVLISCASFNKGISFSKYSP